MSATGIELTLRTLLRSPHPQATELLAIALEGPAGPLQVGAVRALALREDPAGHRRIVERHAALAPQSAAALRDLPPQSPLARGLPDVIRQATPKAARRAAEVAVAMGEVEALPAVIDAAIDAAGEFAPALAADALRLARVLDERSEAFDRWSPEAGTRRPAEPAFVRRAALNSLSVALDRYARQPLGDLLHALLVLTPPDEPALMQPLRDARHPAHEALHVALRTSKSRGAIGVLAAVLGDLRSPQSVVEIATQRCDREGLQLLLERVGAPVGLRVRENCARIESFAWLEPDRVSVLAALSGPAQVAAVQLAAASKVSRRLVARALAVVLTSDEADARLAACRAIDSLPSAVAIDVLGVALASHDAEVIAAAVRQLRAKNYPGSTAVLVALLDHASPAVRDAAGRSLRELSFATYRDTLDELPADARSEVGRLVAKADAMAAPTLRAELGAAAVSRRLHAIELIELMGLGDTLADALAASLSIDKDLGVRTEAARLLGDVSPTDAVIDALVEASTARSSALREVAKAALERQSAEVLQGGPGR